MQTKPNFPSSGKLLSTPRYLEGGVSVGNYDNFNLVTHTSDTPGAVIP
ncbi:hypothetical protein [Abyssogena phaseoliformis symbiont]|nr:hypothetical protein [Abyssogena phaseoliformis symbiont]